MEDFNRTLIEQINDQLKRGFEANLLANEFCVVRTGVDGVLSVLSSTAVTDQHDAVFGPKPFAACIQYVNAYLVTEPLRNVETPRISAAEPLDGDEPPGGTQQ
jgi:hypothetical protein